ncbi:hypothetical protein [Lactobacillus sp.]|uniref:hypothetical protein n=1 Tax=Lactobacillus sp. TaxID=1591 RepID=UPI0019BE21DA|nr:hypothetical protein [Lactobacillus sp.]MBD5429723.1 hypothetical protein [Lactobacillus sp.]
MNEEDKNTEVVQDTTPQTENNEEGVQQATTPSVTADDGTQTSTSVEEKQDNTAKPTNSLHQYYWSTDDMPFEPVWVPFELDHSLYPLVATAPDPSIKQGKFDWAKNIWVDVDNQSTGQKVATLTASVKDIAENVKTLKADHDESVKADKQNQVQMQAMQKMLANSNAMAGQISGQMAQFGTAITELTNAVNKINSAQETPDSDTTSNNTEKVGDK